MPYTDRFQATDDLIDHFNSVVPLLPDEELKVKYAGFLSASAVTVFELAIKDIFIEFAAKKSLIFGNFVEKYFYSINGRITIDDIKNYVKLFGEKYSKKFDQKLIERNNQLLKIHQNIIQASYGNLIVGRHKFIHSNHHTLTFNDVVQGYQKGKELVDILNAAMKR